MREILLIGTGKSTSFLIQYLLEKAKDENIHLTLADNDIENIPYSFSNHEACSVVRLDIHEEKQRQDLIQKADLVISMLPARFHDIAAKDCLTFKKHLLTASYISPALKEMEAEVKKAGLVFLNEMGLDPGIDHMSAMAIIDGIREEGGKILLFESFTGGLVAPESDTNLWNYKFTWNPRNVVLAGQGGAAKFIQEGTYKYIPYHKVFRRTEFMEIAGYGMFEAYANRDSLNYREAYGLQDALTLFRGTMRRVGFSKAWNVFVQLGMTDDSYTIENSEGMSYREFINSFLPYSPSDSVELKLRHILKIDQDDSTWGKLVELNLFDQNKKFTLKNATPAQLLQKILQDSWTLGNDEKDMIVMYHKVGYEMNGKKKQVDANMVVLGENRTYTAMAKTVGLPIAMAAIHILNKKITTPGVHIPIHKEIYEPILAELVAYGIHFEEFQVPYLGYNPDSVAS
ncbi:MAG: saccharopine dehydrogenase NADP-binding domain-containing protein [Flavobacteriaceae bacterium]|nr:saccharopine dehydrogenase NADP-binding domain-containing protein [Flavobacteriaceae bacterium]